ncbi:MAG: UvrD-helicase domain-containing protein [Bacteroides sp.]|nr:UvrD-helicase domain-containing protein [Eubacterium sp.]MCM1418384.1 UvrD-helicase domain-containing protein [Roseburia sp.]MCM1462485.1 UvrD-helicase domain-containing protein [Bacteroides sp.]
MDFMTLKRNALEHFFARTNEMQKKAIFKTEGAVLIIAGAGSGKTTVLCNRIANLLLFGEAYHSDYAPALSEDDARFLELYAKGAYDENITPEVVGHLSELIGFHRAKPWKILAVTFTNKAAAELKERLSRMSAPAADVWAFTFHSCCVRILRRSIESIGYSSNFTIYDTDDSKRVVKAVLESLNISNKNFPEKMLLSAISRAKDKLIPPEAFPANNSRGERDYQLGVIRDVYIEYQKRLKAANALDFDDIIMKTVEVFRSDPAALEYWQNHFDYVMVDEYQDTNAAQYELVKLLAGGRGNLCVVGDEDQSIYRFRGATIENILSFEKEFHGTTIKLEQNYRSTSRILDAANAVIRNNTQHKDKTLWSDLGEGERIKVCRFRDEQSEALFVANEILNAKGKGGGFAENAILYRTNAQSRTFELALGKMAVPYRIIGGTRFYDRKEVRDVLAYLSVINNPYDMVRLSRIINEPKRGIGDATQAEIARIAEGRGISPIEVMEECETYPSLARKAKTLLPVARMFRELIDTAQEREITDLLDDLLEQSGYTLMLMTQGDEGAGRLENIRELKSAMITFCEENENHTLFDYLEQVALISDLDSLDGEEDRVVLMTMHAAKGLEFERVFLVGAEENIFPSYRSMTDATELEEERRLCYVAITRAKRYLYITNAETRLLYGQTMHNPLSRFIREIPPEYMELDDQTKRTGASASSAEPRAARAGRKNYLRERSAPAPVSAPTPIQHFAAGDRIRHRVFGDGTVLSASPLGNDTLLEVGFDTVGTKKLMANFAKITKIE